MSFSLLWTQDCYNFFIEINIDFCRKKYCSHKLLVVCSYNGLIHPSQWSKYYNDGPSYTVSQVVPNVNLVLIHGGGIRKKHYSTGFHKLLWGSTVHLVQKSLCNAKWVCLWFIGCSLFLQQTLGWDILPGGTNNEICYYLTGYEMLAFNRSSEPASIAETCYISNLCLLWERCFGQEGAITKQEIKQRVGNCTSSIFCNFSHLKSKESEVELLYELKPNRNPM